MVTSRTALEPTGSRTAAGAAPRTRTRATKALIAFVAIEVVALPLLLYWGRHRWFQYDEWDFLASREATSLRDLFQPHSVHWSTLPILVYRALWNVFGINSYLPYQVVSVLTHLGVAALVRAVMRRAGVRPWTATALASILVLLGSGEENIAWAFQIGFTGALAFGLVHLLLADHEGGVDRRDALGLIAGGAGLLSSGVAVTMTLVVGVAMLLRRGWRVALLHTLPLMTAFLVWYVVIGREGFGDEESSTASQVVDFVGDAVAATFDGIAQVPGVAWLLGAVLVAGLLLAGRAAAIGTRRARVSLPLALLAGALTFLVITGIGRAASVEIASATRYVHVTASLVLPPIAVAADALMRRWRVITPLFAVALVASIAGNVGDFTDRDPALDEFVHGYRRNFLSMARVPIADEVPRDLHPDLGLAPWVSYGWLRDGVASGRIPAPGAITAAEIATNEMRLVLRRQPGHRPGRCEPAQNAAADVTLQRGGSITLAGPLVVVYTAADGTQSLPLTLQPSAIERHLVAYAGPLELRVTPAAGEGFEVCDRNGGPLTVPGGP